MIMTSRLRKFALSAHVTFSVSWLGAVVAYLAMAVTSLTSRDVQMVRSAYFAMELVGWFVIVPFSLAALLSGVVQSLGTEWGLLRHYWIVLKLLLTVVATVILLLHMPAVSRMAGVAAQTTLSKNAFGGPGIQLIVHATGGLLVLLTATILSVYKPWGLTAYGLQQQRNRRNLAKPVSPRRATKPAKSDGTPWRLYILFGIIGLVLLLVMHHLADGGLRMH